MLAGPVSLIVAYLLGAVPFGYVFVRLHLGRDIRAYGSGSTGATNVTRSAGPLLGLLTLALDVGKGYAAVLLAAWLTDGDIRWASAAAVAAIVGHSYPVFLRFRGGKSVATGVGVFLYLAPLAVAGALLVWLVVVLGWRYVALGSVLATCAYPLFAFAFYRSELPATLAAVACAVIIILRHRSNLERLVQGTEPRFSLKRKP
ncbi:MAG TPA: glycerol-3-phosphate 1-O-acyltransferase PlsY [Candidatus Acidoferrales bacterium]|nr:glycerol-3-phosphate 1-O-acyltransferase PlsY [Candidatus Acidoferrales bacterium]